MKSVRFSALFILVIFLVSCAGVQPFSGAGQEFEKGLALFNAGKYEPASEHFKKAGELDPEFAKAFLYLGRSYVKLDR